MTRVFIIEHDRDFAECLSRILETEGFDVEWVETISKAIAGLPDEEPAIALIDLQDGSTIKPEHIRQLAGAGQNTRILVTADYKTPEVACKALGVGARDYLLKPYGTREIVERIHSLAGTPTGGNGRTDLDRIADSIGFLASLDDVVRFTLDQLTNTLHLADCLLALREEDGFSILASRGYRPDPSSRTIHLSGSALDNLIAGCEDPLALSPELTREIISSLAIEVHRPFPSLMPLVRHDQDPESPELLGFIMGHGALVLEENDILEMELFLTQVARELDLLIQKSGSNLSCGVYHDEGEFLIPQVSRDEATTRLLEYASPYLIHENDLFWIRLVLDEAINNAIIHGHCETLDCIRTNLRLKYSVGPGRIMLTVEDNGDGFDHRNLPDPTSDENLLSINGRGIFIMRSVMDEVVFNERGNQVSLVKKLDGKPLAPFTPVAPASDVT